MAAACSDLNGNVVDECGTCNSQHACHPGAGDFADFAVANEVGTQPQPSPASSSEGLASLAVQADGGIATPSHCPTVLKGEVLCTATHM